MPVQPTSAMAYEELKASGRLGEKRLRVMALFINAYPSSLTGGQCVRELGRGISENVRNRITELVQMGLVERTGLSLDSTTRKKVNTYRWTCRTKAWKTEPVYETCMKCFGSGKLLVARPIQGQT